jgi:hypothetical protein
MTAVDEAALILNFDVAKTGPRYHKVGDTITFAEGSNYMVVRFRVGEPSTGPARHNYAEGSTDVTVTVSREARPQDLRRALTHELAELHAYVADRKANRDGVLHEGSKPTERNALAGRCRSGRRASGPPARAGLRARVANAGDSHGDRSPRRALRGARLTAVLHVYRELRDQMA